MQDSKSAAALSYAAKYAGLEQGLNPVPVVPGRVLRVDADGLAYRFGGYTVGFQQALRYVAEATARAGASEYQLVFTPQSSSKGHRYAIARRKPYQGQRAEGRRPAYWELFRRKLEAHPRAVCGPAEADDRLTLSNGEDYVILSADKDLRMGTGCHHLTDSGLVYVPPEAMCVGEQQTGAVYGWLWFWLQMCHGDSADNIPGLDTWQGKRVGPAAADKLMIPGLTNEECWHIVAEAYEQAYGPRWAVEMLEQAALLWMRTDASASWADCVRSGPMRPFRGLGNWGLEARQEIQCRINQASQG